MAIQPGGYMDNPETDNTPKAHPAFNRGKAKGILETLAIFRNVVVGTDDGSGTINSPEIEKVRRSVFIIREALESGKPATEALAEATKLANTLRFQKQ